MAKTYLELTNIALRDINEVPLTADQFNTSPRGLQATAKEMINRAYADILNYSKEWPFLSATDGTLLSVDTVELQQEYSFPAGTDNIDWDSFFIRSHDNVYASPLQAIDIDFYNQHLRVKDLEDANGGHPAFVYRTKDNEGFGLSPLPNDRGFTVTFAAWTEPQLLVNADDTVAIPDRYYNVIIARARYYLWMFRENAQQAAFAQNEYDAGIKMMHRDLVEKQSISMRAV
jgi:hypothetical protein